MEKITIILIFSISIFNSIWSQNKITELTYNYRHSLTNEEININISKGIDSSKIVIITNKTIDYIYSENKIETTNKEIIKTKYINNLNFDNIINSALSISNQKLISGFSYGKDGAITSISYGDGQNSISYTIWGLDKNNFPDFFKLIVNLFKTSQINWSKIYP